METKYSNEYDGKNRTLYKINCGFCKKEFWIPKHLIKRTKTCSKQCAMDLRKTVRLAIKCSNCNLECLRVPSKLKNSKSRITFLFS